MSIDIETLAAARSYTDDSLNGVGSVQGKNCTIQEITKEGATNTVVFGWYDDDGNLHTNNMEVEDGKDGETGPKGDQGEKGDTGETGASAYEVALANGFEGTEEEWLKSLPPTNIVTVSKSPFESVQGVFKMNEIIAGESEQLTTIGKNLLEISEYNTSASGNTSKYMSIPKLQTNKTYILSGKTSDGIELTGSNTQMFFVDSSNAKILNGTMEWFTKGFVVSENVLSSATKIEIFTSDILANKTINIQLEEGSVATEYEPYTGGVAAPNPSYPQEIKKTVISEVKTYGKNLLDCRRLFEHTEGGITFTPVHDTDGNLKYVNVNGTSFKQVTYMLNEKSDTPKGNIITGCTGGSDATYSLVTGYYDVDGKWKKESYQTAGELLIETSYPLCQFGILVRNGVTLNNVKFYPMVREVGTDSTYEPYTESVIKLPEPIELYGIGDVRDTIEDGKVKRRFARKRITPETPFTGHEGWNEGCFCSYGFFDGSGVYIEGYGIVANLLCTHAKVTTAANVANGHKNKVAQGARDLYVNFEMCSTLAELKQFLTSKEVYVYYELAEEVIEDLPFADKVALNDLSTYSGITYLELDSEIEPGFKGETAVTQEGAYILDVLHNNSKDDYATTSESPMYGCYDGRLKVEEIVAGESQQFSTTGKNLINPTLETTALSGVTCTNNGDGTYKITGTATEDIQFPIAGGIVLEPNVTYTYNSGFVENSETIYTDFTNLVDYGIVAIGTKTFMLTEDTTLDNFRLYVYVKNGSNVNVTLTAQLEKGSVATEYEPYTGGQPSPNPDYPQEIKKTVVSEIRTHGKNLFDASKLILGSLSSDTGVEGDSTAIKRTDFIPCISSSNYTISGIANGVRMFFYDANKAFISTTVFEATNVIKSFVTPSNCAYIRMHGAIANWTDVVMLNEGTVATEYEPYTESVITLSQPIELYDIGDVRDTIKDGTVKRKFEAKVFSGEENWKSSNTIERRYYTDNLGCKNYGYIFCTHAKGVLTASEKVNECHLRDSSNGRLLVNTSFATVDEWKAHLADHPMTVIYELAEETTEELPLADQIALNSLYTFDGITYLEFDSDIQPTFQVEYGTTKNGGYILEGLLAGRNGELLQERIAALEATLVNNI